MKHVLLLAGTAEAREIASALARMDNITAFASLAGATLRPENLDLPTRVGGFGGPDALVFWIKEHAIDAVIDATHPFAAQISENAQIACKAANVPCLQVMRNPWEPASRDRWTCVESFEDASERLTPGQRVFLATGRTSLDAFAQRKDCWFMARVIDKKKSDFPFANGVYTSGRPPFSVEDEMGLFREAEIDVLVTKNAGGENSRSKLLAARKLDLPVLMINRPAAQCGPHAKTAEQAVAWVKALDHG